MISVFFHVATIGDYININNELLMYIKNSGLLDKLDLLYIGVLGDVELKLPYNHSSIQVDYISKNLKLFEYPTVEKLRKFSVENDNCKVMYLCNAGVSHIKNKGHYPSWRELMSYYTIIEHEKCLDHLNDVDVCGVEWQEEPVKHFSGNFWWANSNYIKTLPTLDYMSKYNPFTDTENDKNIIKDYRHGAEFFIGMNKNVKHKDMFNTNYHWNNRPTKDTWLTEEQNKKLRLMACG